MSSSVLTRLKQNKQRSRTNQNSSNLTDDNVDLPRNNPLMQDSAYAQNSVISQNYSYHGQDAAVFAAINTNYVPQTSVAMGQSPIRSQTVFGQFPPRSPPQAGLGIAASAHPQAVNVPSLQDVYAGLGNEYIQGLLQFSENKPVATEPNKGQSNDVMQVQNQQASPTQTGDSVTKPKSIQQRLKERSVLDKSAVAESKVEVQDKPAQPSENVVQKAENKVQAKETRIPKMIDHESQTEGQASKQAADDEYNSNMPVQQAERTESAAVQEEQQRRKVLLKEYQALTKRFEQQQSILSDTRNNLQHIGKQYKMLLERYDLEKLQAQKKVQQLTDEITEKNKDLQELANEIIRCREMEKENAELNQRNEHMQEMLEEQQKNLSRLTSEYMEMKGLVGHLRYEVQAKQIGIAEQQKSVPQTTLVPAAQDQTLRPELSGAGLPDTQFDPYNLFKSQKNRKSKAALQE